MRRTARPDLVVAVDFDGTIVEHTYPEIGKEVPLAIETLRWLQSLGVRIILWTMRHDEPLQEAVNWLITRGITPWSVNSNPEQREWTDSPKAYAHAYIDDAAIGVPLHHPPSGRPYVDWDAIQYLLMHRFNLPPPTLDLGV